MRIEDEGGGVTHVALDPDGEWARSTNPHLLVLVDYDVDDRVIGISFAGPLARIAIRDGVPAALSAARSDEINEPITTETQPAHDEAELVALSEALDALLAQPA